MPDYDKRDYVILGTDSQTQKRIPISDIDRCSGLYILGVQGSGKTNLLKSLILQDIANGHGVFFLDPHGDAIDDLLQHIPEDRKDDIIVVDPTDETYTFGINLLECRDPNSLTERNDTYGQAIDIFTKLFVNPQTQELDILLSQYLPNSFYGFVANFHLR
jgi:GTPase SAR1 family protein